jgi:FkbM family methyltransferase
MEQEINNRLLEIFDMKILPQPHVNYLLELKNSGINPSVIYDIGACTGEWTLYARKIWPNAKIILFEAYENLEYIYKSKLPEHEYHIGLLSSEDNKRIKFYQDPFNIWANSYYKEIGSRYYTTPDYQYTWKISETLDSVVKKRLFPVPDLIKIDVQGAEKDILEGAKETIKSCKNLIVEMQEMEYNEGAPKADITGEFIEKMGFRLSNNGYKFSDNGPDADYGYEKV